jgi:conjugative transfer ATPase
MTSESPALKGQAIRQLYREPASFTDLLPWVEYDPDGACFLLEDGVSVGALFELDPVGTEARTPAFMTELRDALQTALNEAIPEEELAPWVLQVYVQDEPTLEPLIDALRGYSDPRLAKTAFSQHQQAVMEEHLLRINRPGGLFVDEAVTGTAWQGKRRAIRATLYRRYPAGGTPPSAIDAVEALNDTAAKWTAALASGGVRAHRGDGKALYDWLLPWFNPAAEAANGDPLALLRLAPYPGDSAMPFGYEFAEQLTLATPRSADGLWFFDGLPHTVVTVQGLRRAPDIGHMTAERQAGDHVYALFDRLPPDTVMAMTLTVAPQHRIRNRIAQVRRAAVGDSAEALMTREDADAAEREMAGGNKLNPLDIAFYLRGEDRKALRANVNRLHALLLPNGLQPIAQRSDLLAQDSYLRYLPMAYDPSLDRRRRRSRLVFSRHAANLLPLYGRTRGTGHPGLVFYNRGAEPLVFDPLNAADRKKNAHMLILGPTGAGKSALLVYLLQQMLAMHRPRVFIIEAGGSFALLGEHLRFHGLSVNQVTLNPDCDISLPPFADAIKLKHDKTNVSDEDLASKASSPIGGRDLLGEMEIAARIMITGGDAREDARMSRADRLLIRNAIYLAAQNVRQAGETQVLTQDVVAALHEIGRNPELAEYRRHRAVDMGDGMALFCSGLAGHFFNRPGTHWSRADVTILDVGILAREGYEDQLTVAYISMMSHINALIEAHQHDARPTLVVTDEGHIITTNPLLAGYVVKITKMWRKLGAWFWIATQNLEDFPDASRRMLNMMEWWLCLVMPKEEVEQIARFKDLSAEQRNLLLSTRKEPGKYTEGVVLADGLEALFRNVPPPLSLALAMTEKDEKAARADIMRDQDCTELEAVYVIAERLARARR